MEIAYYENQFINVEDKVVPIQERGHQFGDGIYEVIRVYNGKPFLMKEHLNRLERSAEAIYLTLPYSVEKISEIIHEGLKRARLYNADIYLQITRGIAPRIHHFPNVPAVFSMVIKEAKQISIEDRSKGISILLLEDERWANCYIKSLNLLPNVLAKQKAVASGHDEAVFVRDGYITEGSSSNVFVVKDGILYTTPATKQILHGITRAHVMSLAKNEKIPVKEEAFTPKFLKEADEAFITSTTSEILPIRQLEDKQFSTARPVTTRLLEKYQQSYQSL